MAISDKLKEYIQNKIKEECNDNGQIEYYVDYRDKIDSDILKEKVDQYKNYIENIPNEETNIMSFKEYLTESFSDEDWANNLYIEADDDFQNRLYDDAPDELKEELDNLDLDELSNLGYNSLDFNKYIDDLLDNSEIKFEVMFATKSEENRDLCSISYAYGSNTYPSSFEERISVWEDNDLKDYDNTLTYLLHQQGHSVNEIFNDISKRPAGYGYSEKNLSFIKSVNNEIVNCYSDGPCTLVALAKFKGNDFADFVNNIYNPNEIEKNRYLQIKKNAMIGLHDSWAGTTSLLGINLEKDFIVPKEYIRDILIEDAKENQNQGYTVDDVCGLTSDCWEENVITDTNEKPTLLEELNESIINNLKSLVKEEQEKNEEEDR